MLRLLITLLRHKKLVLGLPLAAGTIAAATTFLMSNVYTAKAVLMPPQQQQSSAAALLGQIGFIAGLTNAGIGIKNPNDLYVGILKSRTVADAIIDQFGLQALYDEDTMIDTRSELANRTLITGGRDGLIVIQVDDDDPRRAADMANAYVKHLESLTSNLAVTEAAQRRLFFQRHLLDAKKDLETAEVALREVQEKTGVVQLDQQGRAMIEAVATLRAQIIAREVQLAAMRPYATDKNPELVKTREELGTLRAELRKLEQGTGVSPDLLVPTREIPSAGLEYARKYRDVKYAETIYELMAKQFEVARLDEARDAAIIQVIDRAVAPDKRSHPRRAFITVSVALLTFALTSLGVLAFEFRMPERAS